MGVSYSRQDNRIEDLGGVPPGTFFEGYSIGSIFNEKVLSAEFVPGTVTLRNVMCDGGTGADGLRQGGQPVPCAGAPRLFWGKNQPTWLGNVRSSVTILRNLRLAGVVEYQGGHISADGDLQARHTTFENTQQVNPITDPILQAYRLVVPRTPIALFDRGFATLREVSASYTIPESITRRVGSSNAQLTVAARNAFPYLWEAQDFVYGHKLMDVEVTSQMHIPQTAQVMATLRFTY
jgi:hypothetical protein